MRAGIGLVGLLLCIGVIVWIMGKSELPHDEAAIKEGKKMTEQVNQMAGNSRDGQMKFSDSVVLEPQLKNGATDSVLVTKVVTGGPADTFFGLKEEDAIVEIGPLPVREQIQNSKDAADMVMDAYQHQYTLTVLRKSQRIKLPQPGARSAPPANQPSGSPLQNQLDAIQKSTQSR